MRHAARESAGNCLRKRVGDRESNRALFRSHDPLQKTEIPRPSSRSPLEACSFLRRQLPAAKKNHGFGLYVDRCSGMRGPDDSGQGLIASGLVSFCLVRPRFASISQTILCCLGVGLTQILVTGEAARVCKRSGANRKYALFLRQAALLHHELCNDEIALRLSDRYLPFYQIPLSFKNNSEPCDFFFFLFFFSFFFFFVC